MSRSIRCFTVLRWLSATAIVPLLAILVGSCGGSTDGSGTPPPPPPTGTSIGPAGGTVASADGGALLTFPSGALASTLSITAAPMTDPPASPGLVTGRAYDFGPSGSQFAQPVTIKLTYQPSQVPAGVSPVFLRLFVRNGTGWDSVRGSAVDTAAHTVTGTTTHFSGFGACGYPVCGPVSIGSSVGAEFFQLCCTNLQQGGSVLIYGTIETINYSGSVAATVENLPTGVTGSIAIGPPPGQVGCATACFRLATITLNAAASTVLGQYAINVRVISGAGIPDAVGPVPVMITAIPGYVLAVAPSTISIAQGNSVNATVTIARTLFTAPVTLSAGILPSGVTASFNPAQLTGATLTSILTLTASSSVPAGTSNIGVVGTAAGLANQVATVPLTVSAFAVTGTPPSVTVAPGATATTGIKVTRAGGFVGTLTYAVSGLPTGLTASVTPTSVADSAQLSLTAAANLTAGAYQITVIATSGTTTEQTIITVTVATSTGIREDWSQCVVKPVWFAYQDGNGPWTRLVGVGDVYSVPTLAAGQGGIAVVIPNAVGTGFTTGVNYATQAEFSSQGNCSPAGLAANGTISGLDTGHHGDTVTTAEGADISLGQASTATGNGAYTLSNISSGTHDLVAYLQRTSGDRVIIDRGVSGGGTLPSLDFTPGVGGVAVDTALFTVNGGPGSTPSLLMSYITRGCEVGTMYYVANGIGAPVQVTGVPPALQLSTDLHSLSIIEFTGSIAQEVTTMFHTLANRTVTLGSSIAPTVTVLSGPYKRLQGVLSMPTDYNYVNFSINFAVSSNHQSLSETTGYSGSRSITLAMPDFSAVPGFSSSWEGGVGEVADYSLNATSVTPFGARQCGEGLTTRNAYLTGSN